MKRTVVGLCAAVVLSVVAISAQTKPTTPPRAVDPDAVIISGCLNKGADGKYSLTSARRESGATGGSISSATWTIDITDLVAGILKLDSRVGQRVELVGRVTPESKVAGKVPAMQLSSLKPIATTACK